MLLPQCIGRAKDKRKGVVIKNIPVIQNWAWGGISGGMVLEELVKWSIIMVPPPPTLQICSIMAQSQFKLRHLFGHHGLEKASRVGSREKK